MKNNRVVIISETPQLPLNGDNRRVFPEEGGTVEIVFGTNYDAPLIGLAWGAKKNKLRNAHVDNASVSFYEDDSAAPSSKFDFPLKAGRHTLVVTSYPISSTDFEAGNLSEFSVSLWKEYFDDYGNSLGYSGGGFGFYQPVSD